MYVAAGFPVAMLIKSRFTDFLIYENYHNVICGYWLASKRLNLGGGISPSCVLAQILSLSFVRRHTLNNILSHFRLA
jgi:hypothetical protein